MIGHKASTAHAELRFEVVSVGILHTLWILKVVVVSSRQGQIMMIQCFQESAQSCIDD